MLVDGGLQSQEGKDALVQCSRQPPPRRSCLGQAALAWARAVMRRMYEAAAAALCRRVMLTMGAMAGTPRPASEI